MNEVMSFDFQGNSVRSVLIEGNPYLVAKDVAMILGFSNSRKAIIDHVDNEDKLHGVTICDSMGREQQPVLINESGVYSLIFGSKLPKAKAFKRWVTNEVLPSLRQYGTYSINHDNEPKREDKVLLNNMIELSKNLLKMTESTTEICKYLAMVIKESNHQSSHKNEDEHEEVTIDYSKCKLEQFPDSIKREVDNMMEEMISQEKLNFSFIARYCVIRGYPISSPAVKSYYKKTFKEH